MVFFNKEMSNYLVEVLTQNSEEFFPKSREAHYARRAQDAWKDLTNNLNSSFGTSVTEKQVRDKWHNIRKQKKPTVFSASRKLV
jgi:hypothetical protein